MSILVPIASTGITFSEIPDHTAYYFEIGSCTKFCPCCHSPHLRGYMTPNTPLLAMETKAENAAE